ncbi:MAG TPA: MFS transporter [Caulobacteraceae bacterium]|nr:MFS transporter [Caulobacteraceae bacterium]
MNAPPPSAFEAGPAKALTFHQWSVVAVSGAAAALEFLDGYIIAFVLAFITGPWKLHYGQIAIVLLSSGVGGLVGSFVWGHFADKMGRRATLAATVATCAIGSLAMAATPTGNWGYLAALRFVVGFGVGGFFVPMMLVQEFLPAAKRGRACGIVSAAAAAGLVLGALSGAFLGPLIGWRGMFMVGGLPLLLAAAIYRLIPESPQWLLTKGRDEDARQALAWAFGPGAGPAPAASPAKAQWRDLLRFPSKLLAGCLINLGVVTGYYGMTLWSPTLISQIQGIPGAKAAKLMITISLAGLVSRFVVSALSDRIGRRRCGIAVSALTGAALMLAALVGHGDLLDRRDFWLFMIAAFVFADSTFAVNAVYTSEMWPPHLRGRGSGVAYAAGGIGKIIGPLGFALAVGSADVVKPVATVQAIIVAFGYLAAMFWLAGITYLLVRIDAPATEAPPARATSVKVPA